MIYLIVWVACAIICYNIMKNKNRNTTIGIVLGFFLGLIGVIICLCLSDKKSING